MAKRFLITGDLFENASQSGFGFWRHIVFDTHTGDHMDFTSTQFPVEDGGMSTFSRLRQHGKAQKWCEEQRAKKPDLTKKKRYISMKQAKKRSAVENDPDYQYTY